MRFVFVLGLVVCLLATKASSKPTPAIPSPTDILAEGIERLMLFFRNPNQPFGRAIRKIKQLTAKAINHDFSKVGNDFDKSFESNETFEQMTDMDQKPDPKALNPVVGAIQTVGDLAQLLVAVGQQVLPGLIAGIAAYNPVASAAAPQASRDHGMLLKSIIDGFTMSDIGGMIMATENETKYTSTVEI